jgi:copper homeostasis protein (lipoprotein)
MFFPPPSPAAMPRFRLPALVLLLALAACTPDSDRAGAGPAGTAAAPGPLQADDTERTWVGLLPCRDCQGIDTRLVLRTERGKRVYLLTETYLGGSGQTSFNRAGSWTEKQARVGGEPQTTYVLDPDKAAQLYVVQPDGALELLGADGKAPEDALAYRLQRL